MRPSDLSGPAPASQPGRLPVALLALLALVVCSLSLAASARADGAPPVASPFGSSLDRSQLIVTFKQTSGPAAVSSTLADAGATKIGTITHTASTIVAVPELAADAALATLRRDPDVASVRVDPVVQLTLSPNDPQFHYPFNPCANSLGCWPYSELNLPTAWDTTTGSASVTVAVVDTGVAPSHEDLSGAVLPGWNFVAGNANAADDNGHGTEVAGMIAARGNNGIGVVGSCWSCKILPVKVLSASGSGYVSAVANGITWATDHGAKVINLSIGGAGGDPSYTMALNYAVAHGVFVAIAAGNAGSSDPGSGLGGYPGYYAKSIAGAVSVGAVDYSKVLYDFSNYGDWVEVGAPGCELTTAMDGTYTSMCGTSAAAPQVAGAAALALSYDPSLTPAELEQHLETSADASHPAFREGPSGGTVSCGGTCTAFGLVDDHALLQSLAPPSPTSLPALTGTAQVGQTLSGTDAGFSGAAPITLTHAWLRCDASGNSCTSISGATGSSYTLVSADFGATLRFQTTAANPYGSVGVNSAASAVIAAPPPPILSGQLLTLQGTTAVGGTFSAAQPDAFYFTGTIDSYSYAWTRCAADGSACATVPGVSTSTYPLSGADQGSTIKERITATNIALSVAIDSALSAVVLPPPPAPGLSGMAFTLQGTVAVGSSLSASQASAAYFTGAVESYGYSWLRCDASGSACTAIVTATASSYTLTTADQGHTLMERISATNGGGTVSLDSAASALLPVPPDPPVVTPPSGGGGGGGGSSAVPPDLTLTLSTSADTVAVGGQVLYAVSVFSKNIGSATGMHLIVTLPTGATLAGSTVTRGSGCVQTGPTVDCNLDFLSPPQSADVRLTVSFATAGSFTLPFTATTRDRDADPSNNQASATVTVTDPSRAAAGQATSSGPKLLTRPTIDGTFMVGEKLTASTGHWQGKRIKYRYSWRRCNANGSRCSTWKSTTRSYLLVATDRGKRITFMVTATDAAGSRQASSTATPVVLGPLKRQ